MRALTTRSTATTQPVGRTKFGPLLLFAITGYMFFDRAFAWLIHVPGIPIFLGEVLLAFGVVETIRARQALRFLVARSATAKWILAFVAMGLVRLVTDIAVYRLDAVRDAAIFYYSALVIIVATYVMMVPEVIGRATRAYTRIIPWYLVWAPIAVFVGRTYAGAAPRVPGSLTSIFSFKGGDYAVWIALAIAYVWLVEPGTTSSEIRRRAVLTITGAVGLLVAGSQNRGGMLVGATVIALTILLSRRPSRTFFRIAGIGIALFGLLFVMDARLQTGKREISVRQIVVNIRSTVSEGQDSTLDGTKRWRLQLWNGITQDVIYGDFPFGFGMGPNIAELYDAVPVQQDAFQTLRSAHNSHLTILARMGIPGATIWGLIWVTFVIASLRVRLRLRREDPEAASVLTWLLIGIVAILANAVFDPSLEGPQVAVPFYALVGTALGMIARADAGYPAMKAANGGKQS